MASNISQEEIRLRARIFHDFEAYSSLCLKIKDVKTGSFIPFKFNKAQKYFLLETENQKKKTGKIRAIILKARQVGCSTWIEGKGFHFSTHREGANAFILTHCRQSTEALFKMTKTFYDFCPYWLKPSLGKSNANELYFDGLKSGYMVGTASEKAQGRGTTNRFFHGSEVAFWQNAHEHISGVLKSIPNATDTEVYLESTANGTDNVFYELWSKASRGVSDMIPLFVPWFWEDTYSLDIPIQGDMALDDEEKEYSKCYSLSNAQMFWRRNEIAQFSSKSRDGHKEFDKEFPASPSVAFSVSRSNSFISSKDILNCINCNDCPPSSQKVIGVDIAAEGNDFNALIIRSGRKAYGLKMWQSDDTMVTVDIISRYIKEETPQKVFIDSIGVGKGVYDRLRQMFGDMIISVCVAKNAIYSDRFSNKRAEIWASLKDWIVDSPSIIPNDESLKMALESQEYEHDSKNRLKMVDKDIIRRRIGHSPDAADALALTFAFPDVSNGRAPIKYPDRGYV